ncbi:hypothetical protein F5B18DRAFT_670662 [Nemania serpens]|nr:hypothetical protein F5B18DRAFT_670662 [Nemania serpens]
MPTFLFFKDSHQVAVNGQKMIRGADPQSLGAALDRIACAWGFQEPWRQGEEPQTNFLMLLHGTGTRVASGRQCCARPELRCCAVLHPSMLVKNIGVQSEDCGAFIPSSNRTSLKIS